MSKKVFILAAISIIVGWSLASPVMAIVSGAPAKEARTEIPED